MEKKSVPCLLHLDLLVADPPNLLVSLELLEGFYCLSNYLLCIYIYYMSYSILTLGSFQMTVFGILHSVHSRKIYIAAKPDLISAAYKS